MESPIFTLSLEEFKSVLKNAIREVIAEQDVNRKNEETLINVQEAAALLNLAVHTLYEKTSSRLIPHYKHGKKLMFKKSELLAWIQLRKRKTIIELKDEALDRDRQKQKGQVRNSSLLIQTWVQMSVLQGDFDLTEVCMFGGKN